MATLATAFVDILPDLQRFPAELRVKAGKAAGAAGPAVGKTLGQGIMAGIGAVFAAGVIVKFFRGAFNEAMEAARVMRLTEAALKSTAGAANVNAREIEGLADSLSAMVGVDDELIIASENLLLRFTRIRNEVGAGNDIFNQATESALNLSAGLGKDLTASTLMLGKALNDPIRGLTALGKAGVQFTDAQKEQIRTMVEAGNVMGAQKLILAELETRFAGAAEAAALPADKARVSWQNFQEMVGEKLLPTLNDILTWGLANQRWLIPTATAIASLAVVIGAVVIATKAWNLAQAALGIGLDTTSAKAKRAALAVTGVVIAAQAISAVVQNSLNPQIEALGEDLADFGRTGRLGGEALRVVGSEADDLNRILAESDNVFTQFGTGAADMVTSLLGIQGPSAEAAEKFQAMDAALANLVQSGRTDAAAAAFKRLWETTQANGGSLEDLQAKFPAYVAAAGLAAKKTRELGDASSDAAVEAESLLDVWNELHGEMLSADEAMLDAKQAIDGVTEAFKDGSKSISGNSVAALENRISLEKSAQAAADAAQKYRDNGGSAAGAAKMMEEFRRKAVGATGATGAQKTAIEKLSRELFNIPKNTTAKVHIAVTGLGNLHAAARTIREMDRVTGVSSGGILTFAGGGGMEQHVAQMVKAGVIRVWGEPETGGEGYIPLAPAKRTRSMAVMTEIARRFGHKLVPTDGRGEAIPVGTSMATGPAGADSGRLLAVLEAILQAVLSVAPALGRELTGAATTLQQRARSR